MSLSVTPALLSTLILIGALALFVSERVRHDLVALAALFACLAAGLVTPMQATSGFADPAVVAVAAILVVGRAVELSGVASAIARMAVPTNWGFAGRLSGLLVLAALLSAFMNNIAALVITMPIATEIARANRLPPAATLMPLAFATILGGTTTLIGTPANLILSSVREDTLGTPFGFFTMTPVAAAVTVAGLGYLALIGWRLLPIRTAENRDMLPPWRAFELAPMPGGTVVSELLPRLRAARARAVALFRDGQPLPIGSEELLGEEDRLLIVSRSNQWTVAEQVGLRSASHIRASADAVTVRTVVANGSVLIGLSTESVRIRSQEQLSVVAVAPSAARRKEPLGRLRIEAGDELFVRGAPADLARFVASARLLEVDRIDPAPVSAGPAAATLAIFGGAIASIVIGGVSPSIAFLAAAALIAAARLIPSDQIYQSVDWSIVVLLAAMIPVGQSFQTSGAAMIAAWLIGDALAGRPLAVTLGAICALTLLLSIFLNNVATAIIMGPLAIDAARLLGVSPDAALLAVLIGASADFLTPIGHQNNLLVMGPGGYRFTDYARMGAPLVVIVVVVTGLVLARLYS